MLCYLLLFSVFFLDSSVLRFRLGCPSLFLLGTLGALVSATLLNSFGALDECDSASPLLQLPFPLYRSGAELPRVPNGFIGRGSVRLGPYEPLPTDHERPFRPLPPCYFCLLAWAPDNSVC